MTVCLARKQGTAGGNDPVDCDWPHCGCDPTAVKVIEALQEENWIGPRQVNGLFAMVDKQANDDGLWFIAKTAAEAYLQQELRQLHAAIEALKCPT